MNNVSWWAFQFHYDLMHEWKEFQNTCNSASQSDYSQYQSELNMLEEYHGVPGPIVLRLGLIEQYIHQTIYVSSLLFSVRLARSVSELLEYKTWCFSGTIMMSGCGILTNGKGTRREYGEFNLDELTVRECLQVYSWRRSHWSEKAGGYLKQNVIVFLAHFRKATG